MNPENIIEHQFKPGESGNPKGRPRKIHSFIKQMGYSTDDIREAFNEIGWHNLSDLQQIFDNKDAPAILKVVAHAYKKAAQGGDYRYVREILEQVIGKPKQEVDQRIVNMQLFEPRQMKLPDGTLIDL